MSTDGRPSLDAQAPTSLPDGGPSRRGLMVAAAWSVPIIAVASATPAHATSADSTLTIVIAKDTITAGGTGGANATTVTVTVLDSQGRPWAGQPVSLTVSPTGATLTATTGTTNAAGQFSTTLTAAATAAGGTRTVTATSGPLTSSDTVVVLGTNVVQAGGNSSGQLGTGGTTAQTTPGYTARVFPSPVSQTASGTNFTLYLLEDGTVWSVGNNANGQLGLGSTTSTTTPTQIPNLTGVTQIAASDGAGYALVGGQVRAWGLNSNGQLGDGTTTTRTSPVTVRAVGGAAGSALTGVTQLAAGGTSAYALVGGQVRAWGNNANGQLGDGGTTSSTAPVTVRAVGGAAGSALTGVTQLAASQATAYAVVAGGEVRAWGRGSTGNLGNNTETAAQSSPVAVLNAAGTANLTNVTQVAATQLTAAAVLASGQVRAWGGNNSGELGNGSTTGSLLPVTVTGIGGTGSLTQIAEISSGFNFYVARTTAGGVVAWGNNSGGQLGNGTTGATQSSPVAMTLPSGRTARRLGSPQGRPTSPAQNFSSVILAP